MNQAAPTTDRRRTDTGVRILDAAEKLFSEHGYDGVSIRDITSLAGVRLALATYHFVNKETLLARVLERRAEVLNQERRSALAAALAKRSATVTDVLTAFVEPYVRYAGGGEPGWRNYCRLIAILSPSGRWPELLGRLFDDTARQFIEALMVVQGSVDRIRATRCFLFCVGAMLSSFAGSARLDRLTHGAATPTDLRATYACLIPFLAGGVTAVAQLPQEKKRGRAAAARAE